MPVKSRKIAVIGSRSVGKSSVTMQYVERRFVQDYYPTIENTYTKTVNFRNQEYRLEICDTAGQDEYSIISSQHSIGIHGYVLVYSITSKQSFELLNTVRDKLLSFGGSQVGFVLVGNKCDLEQSRQVSIQQLQQLAHEWNCAYIESSAKANVNIDNIFELVLSEIDRENGAVVKEPTQRGCIIS